jgi:CheY-like chemotaxis protein
MTHGRAAHAERRRSEPFDGIFLDIQMPGSRGPSFARSSAARPATSDVPIIMLTAMTERRFLHGAYAQRGRRLHHQAVRAGRHPRQAGQGALAAAAAQSPEGEAGELWRRRLEFRVREVINALEDAVLLSSGERCIRRDAFQNYLLQTKNRPGAAFDPGDQGRRDP